MIPPVLSQRTYPGVGDIDDCAVIATIWAAIASRPTIYRPSVEFFRAKAGRPDLPGATGLNIDQVLAGATGCWPALTITKYQSADYKPLIAAIKADHPASVPLDSAALPARLRYNFYGKHQVGIAWDGRALRCMNPLAPDGSPTPTITQVELLYAMSKLTSPASYRAVLFPKPVPGVAWGWDVADDIQNAYPPRTVALKLRDLGITTYGDRINLIDLEAGLKARSIDFGQSVQLIDVQALMNPGT